MKLFEILGKNDDLGPKALQTIADSALQGIKDHVPGLEVKLQALGQELAQYKGDYHGVEVTILHQLIKGLLSFKIKDGDIELESKIVKNLADLETELKTTLKAMTADGDTRSFFYVKYMALDGAYQGSATDTKDKLIKYADYQYGFRIDKSVAVFLGNNGFEMTDQTTYSSAERDEMFGEVQVEAKRKRFQGLIDIKTETWEREATDTKLVFDISYKLEHGSALERRVDITIKNGKKTSTHKNMHFMKIPEIIKADLE